MFYLSLLICFFLINVFLINKYKFFFRKVLNLLVFAGPFLKPLFSNNTLLTPTFSRLVKAKHKENGFTLIEIMIVIFIIGLFSGLAVLTVGDNLQRNLEAEAERLQKIVNAAADEAIFTGKELGIYLESSGYMVLVWLPSKQSWASMNRRGFLPYEVPESITLEWTIDGFVPPSSESEGDGLEDRDLFFTSDEENIGYSLLDAIIDESDDEEEEEQQDEEGMDIKLVSVTPQIVTLSSGELSVFSVHFNPSDEESETEAYRLYSDGFSLPRIRRVDAESAEEREL